MVLADNVHFKVLLAVVVVSLAGIYVTFWTRGLTQGDTRDRDEYTTSGQALQYDVYRGHKDHDITLVTMYLNLGRLQKKGGWYNDTSYYLKVMDTWAWINNSVVAFFDDSNSLQHFRKIRSHQPAERTTTFLVTRKELPAFRDLDRVAQIFSQPGYPKHHPNTVNPAYSVMMNAKYDVIDRVLKSGTVTTKYIAWIDMGCFRTQELLREEERNTTTLPDTYRFKLELPPFFNQTTVSFAKFYDRDSFFMFNTPTAITKSSQSWVSCAFFVSALPTMERFIQDYRSAVQDLLAMNMSNTDRQVIASLHSRLLPTKPRVEISTWSAGPRWKYTPYTYSYHMAYRCKKEGYIRTIWCDPQ